MILRLPSIIHFDYNELHTIASCNQIGNAAAFEERWQFAAGIEDLDEFNHFHQAQANDSGFCVVTEFQAINEAGTASDDILNYVFWKKKKIAISHMTIMRRWCEIQSIILWARRKLQRHQRHRRQPLGNIRLASCHVELVRFSCHCTRWWFRRNFHQPLHLPNLRPSTPSTGFSSALWLCVRSIRCRRPQRYQSLWLMIGQQRLAWFCPTIRRIALAQIGEVRQK